MLRRLLSPVVHVDVTFASSLPVCRGRMGISHLSAASTAAAAITTTRAAALVGGISPLLCSRRFMSEKQSKSGRTNVKKATKKSVNNSTTIPSNTSSQMITEPKESLSPPQLSTLQEAVRPPVVKEGSGEHQVETRKLIKRHLDKLPPQRNKLYEPTNSTLVYNALIGRMTSETSPSVQCLKSIGFGINEKRQVYVEKPDVLRQLAQNMRDGKATLPANWPISIIRALGVILRSRNIPDPADAIQQMIQVKINNLTQGRYSTMINTVGGTEETNDFGNLLDEMKNVELNEEQQRVINLALKGHLLYIGGSAGTGKTILLRVLNQRMQSERLRVAMTATTGVAGCHIGGSTFHHSLGVTSHGDFLRKSHLLDYDVIIIDEVSMLSKRFFEQFDRVMREEAGTPDLPFGGVQIVLCGDFLQLGVINEESILSSKVFQDSFVKVSLGVQVRQASNKNFADALQKMRVGVVPETLMQGLKQLPPGTMVESAVNLLPTNKEVHIANDKELERLPGEAITLTPETGITALRCDATATVLLRTEPGFNEEEFSRHVRSLLQATLDLPRASLLNLYRVYEDGHAMRVCLPPGESAAWRDAMRERFLEVAGLINDLELGAVVTEILPNADGLHTPESEEYLQKLMSKHPIAQPVTFKKGCRVLLRSNLSSRLVNGSIGTVVDFVECSIDNIPGFLRNERVTNCVDRYRVYSMTECGMQVPLLPVVKFHSGETIVVPPWEFTVGGGPITNYYTLSSVALPLSLAYAFTVHKVQGLTLVGRVHLELSRMWPCEHLLYVAMSRVRNPEQLSISSFTPNMVMANAECVAFDSQLPNVDAVGPTDNHPISSWKRCNDTIYHLRRQGASLRNLLRGVTLQESNGGSTASRRASGSVQLTGPPKGSIEHSVLVARRMRKLIKHTERVGRTHESRRRSKAIAITINDENSNNADDDDDDSDTTEVEHIL